MTRITVDVDQDETTEVTVESSVQSTASSSLLLEAAQYFIEFTKNALIFQSLTGEWLHQLFMQLENYDNTPSKRIQQTWLGFIVIGVASIMSFIAMLLNHRHAKNNAGNYLAAEDWLATIFSSSFLFFALDVFVKNNGVLMPMAWFVITSAVGLPMFAALFFKLASPESSNEMICPWSETFRPRQYLLAPQVERHLNAVKSMKNAFFTVATLLWCANREFESHTVAIKQWQWPPLLLFVGAAYKIGYEMTTHPKFYQGFCALLKFLEVSALVYAAISGMLYLITVYQCAHKTFCANDMQQVIFSYVCGVLAISFGFHAAATTRVRFEKNHASNEKIMTAYENAATAFREKKTEIAASCGDACQRASLFFHNLCSRESEATVPNDNDSLDIAFAHD